jgi:hypothetical protein
MERRRPGLSRIPRPSAVALGVALPLLAALLLALLAGIVACIVIL